MPPTLTRLLRAWMLVAIIDGLFASASAYHFGSTATRTFQGVAATLLGPSAFQGGTRTALIGVAMHFGVALAWTAAFLFGVGRLPLVRRTLARPLGAVRVAAIYGPMIWLVMSLIVIPLLLHAPTRTSPRWWVQLIGHFPFVGLPIVAGIVGGLSAGRSARR